MRLIESSNRQASFSSQSLRSKLSSLLDAETFAASQNIKYFETSAKSGIGVEEMFTEITRQALEQKKADQPTQSNQAKGAGSLMMS